MMGGLFGGSVIFPTTRTVSFPRTVLTYSPSCCVSCLRKVRNFRYSYWSITGWHYRILADRPHPAHTSSRRLTTNLAKKTKEKHTRANSEGHRHRGRRKWSANNEQRLREIVSLFCANDFFYASTIRVFGLRRLSLMSSPYVVPPSLVSWLPFPPQMKACKFTSSCQRQPSPSPAFGEAPADNSCCEHRSVSSLSVAGKGGKSCLIMQLVIIKN